MTKSIAMISGGLDSILATINKGTRNRCIVICMITFF